MNVEHSIFNATFILFYFYELIYALTKLRRNVGSMSSDGSDAFETDLVMSSLSPRTKRRLAAQTYSFDGLQRAIPLTDDDAGDRLLEGILILGAYPWEQDQTPRILASFPGDYSAPETLLQFCYPQKTAAAEPVKVGDLSDLMQLAAARPDPRELEFFVLYFANSDQSPYYFCCRFPASAFSVPVVCHDLTLSQVFEKTSGKSVPHSNIVIAIPARFPYQELYFQMLKWLVAADGIERTDLANFIDKLDAFKWDFKKAEEDVIKHPTEKIPRMPMWPSDVRGDIRSAMNVLLDERLHEGGYKVRIDIEKFPVFVWERPPSERNDLPLGWFAVESLVDGMSPDVYLHLIEALCLERKVIVHGARNSTAAHAVLALKYMRYPLPQAIPVVSLVPGGNDEVLENEEPMIVGTSKVPSVRHDNFVILDADTQSLEVVQPLPEFPNRAELRSEIVRCLERYATSKCDGARALLSVTNKAVNELTYPMKYAFHATESGAVFDMDSYLACFTDDSREFVRQFTTTRAFNAYVDELRDGFATVGLPYPLPLIPLI